MRAQGKLLSNFKAQRWEERWSGKGVKKELKTGRQGASKGGKGRRNFTRLASKGAKARDRRRRVSGWCRVVRRGPLIKPKGGSVGGIDLSGTPKKRKQRNRGAGDWGKGGGGGGGGGASGRRKDWKTKTWGGVGGRGGGGSWVPHGIGGGRFRRNYRGGGGAARPNVKRGSERSGGGIQGKGEGERQGGRWCGGEGCCIVQAGGSIIGGSVLKMERSEKREQRERCRATSKDFD